MNTTKEWVSTAAMTEHLGIHPQTILKLRRSKLSPFREGIDFRWGGITSNGTLQWHQARTEASFTGFRRLPSYEVETYSGKAKVLLKRT